MNELVERVARAISLRQAEIMLGADPATQAADPRALARAAIEAMREPTEAMQLAPPDVNFSPMDAKHVWHTMIDAALE